MDVLATWHRAPRRSQKLVPISSVRSLHPRFAAACVNLGNVLGDLSRLDEALASLAKAVSRKPDYASAHWNISLTRLLLGDFDSGWKLYEWRWQMEPPNWPVSIPRWRGEEPLDGKTIVPHAEQGLGDAIQFCRYARLVAARGATVLLQVRPAARIQDATRDHTRRRSLSLRRPGESKALA